MMDLYIWGYLERANHGPLVFFPFFRIKDLSNPSIKFKIDTNSKQLFMTGLLVLFKDCNIVVVEGGK